MQPIPHLTASPVRHLMVAAALALLAAILAGPSHAQDVISLRSPAREAFLSAHGEAAVLVQRGQNVRWTVEPVGNGTEAVRLRHADGGYLHVEQNARVPAIGPVGPGWLSAMWVLEPIANSRQIRIRNTWRQSYLLAGEDGPVMGPAEQGAAARWRVIPADRPARPARQPSAGGMTAIPAAGNAFFNTHRAGGARVSEDGIVGWDDPAVTPTLYLHLQRAGRHRLSLMARAPQDAVIEAQVGEDRHRLRIHGGDWARYDIGTVDLPAGYVAVTLRGLRKQGPAFADIQAVEIDAPRQSLRFVEDGLHSTRAKSYYYGRRGPTGTLFYRFPPDRDIEWFYSEVTVPRGSDVTGSYFEANGCAEGYFGFQVNGPDRRLVLFSVWSPYKTDNPADIPPDQRVQLVAKGPRTTIAEFGNEGSGGQSYFEFPWKAGLTYGFLSRVRPNGDGTTDYSAWFHDPEADLWHQVATFRRPRTDTWYRSPYAFLENFYPEWGAVERRALYGNQWARDTRGHWVEITQATLAVDATGRKEGRLDYAAGVQGERFALRGFGFFNGGGRTDFELTRQASGQPPQVNLSRLPQD